jgi:hypothetical protein
MTPCCAQTFMKSLPVIGTATVNQEFALTHHDGEEFVVRLQAPFRSSDRMSFELIDFGNIPLAGISAKALTSICQHKPRRAARTLARETLVLLGRLHRVAGRMGSLSHPTLIRSAVPFLDGALMTTEKMFSFAPITDLFVMVGTDWVPDAAMTTRDHDVAAVWSGLSSRPKASIHEVWGWDAFETYSCELEFENE